MKIISIGHLNMQIGKISVALQKKDKKEMEKLYRDYQKELSVPSKDIYHTEYVTLSSKHISYHLLSVYYLLDFIDKVWDGNEFVSKKEKQRILFQKELTYTEEGEMGEIDDYKEIINQISGILTRRLYIFMHPFQPKDDKKTYAYVDAMPGDVIILFAQSKDKVFASLCEGVASFYIKTILQGHLPPWANTTNEFISEFTLWCKNSPSRFN